MRAGALVFLCTVLLCLTLAGCGGGSGSTGGTQPQPSYRLAVAQGSFGRVLLFKNPTTNGAAADLVLDGNEYRATRLYEPQAVNMDAAGNLYVADYCALLRFAPPFSPGMKPNVYFQPISYCNNGAYPNVDATLLGYPRSLAFDAQGNLWIADQLYARVVQYPASLAPMQAQVEVGWPSMDFNSLQWQYPWCDGGTYSPTAKVLCRPTGMTIDSAGNLWVADQGNGRVLKYTPPFANGMAASLVLGRPDMVTYVASSISSSSLNQPYAIAFDAKGNLWVSDTGNNRILGFAPPFSSGMDATVVIGQNSFTAGAANQGASTPSAVSLSFPLGLSLDSKGNLWVGDNGNSRVLRFTPPFSSGMGASLVLGQNDFTQKVPCLAASPSAACNPIGIAAF